MRTWDPASSTPAAPPRPFACRIAALVPGLFPGAALHRVALWMASAGAHDRAMRLFEAAAARYRRELRVEPLARLRVHQRMFEARARAGDADAALEIERRLLTLREIESPRPPFAMVDARSLVGVWPALIGCRPADAARRGAPARPLRIPA